MNVILKKLKRELGGLEESIEKLELEKVEIENELSMTELYDSAEKLKAVQDRFQRVSLSLDELNNQWEQLAMELDSLNA
jgi:chromosome segregation ATPase